MKSMARPFLLLAALILVVGVACNMGGGGGGVTPTPSGSGNNLGTTPQTSSGGAGSLDDVQKATIQIESEGTFEDPQFGLEVNAAGRGSGFIIDPSGLAITNNHVVTGAALVKVWVGGETTPRNARVVAASECSDLALIDIEGDGYPTLNWYTQSPKIGLEVYAAGFPLGEPQFSLTKGIVSKTDAPGQTSWSSLDTVLGHDATINPGNSGGPLVTQDGQVVGVNYSSRASANQYFAIPAAIAMSVFEQLKQGQDFESIGINGSAVASQDGSLTGIWVASVKSGSPADKARIQAGDIIYQLEGIVLGTDGTMKDYCDILRSHKPSDTLSLQVIRFGTGELLEGQLNGRELAVTGTFDVSGAGGGNGGSSGGTSATEAPTTAAGSAPDFYKEEFDNGADNYKYFVIHGDDNQIHADNSDVNLNTQDSSLVFDILKQNRYIYVYYDPYTYTDVSLEMVAENQGKNSNNVTLFCRYNADQNSWYEFNVSNGGEYWIYAYTDGSYHTIADGGSTAVNEGRATNDYVVGCHGQELALVINGQQVRTVTDTNYNLKEGRVGFGVSSFNVLPITVAVNSFTIGH
jgi:S1-C subfamily serine protease